MLANVANVINKNKTHSHKKIPCFAIAKSRVCFSLLRRHFIMKSGSGTFKIQKGQKLVGNCHLAHRDKKVFEVPGSRDVNEFDPTRFKQKVGWVTWVTCLIQRRNPVHRVTTFFILVKITIMWLVVRGAGRKDGVSGTPFLHTYTLDNSFYWESHVYFHIFICFFIYRSNMLHLI